MFDLREYKESDAELILSWIADEKSFRQWSADKYKSYPASAQDVNDFYGQIKANGARAFMFYDDGKAIGHFVMRPLVDETVKTVRMGFIIIDAFVRGMGYGKAMLKEALRFAFEKLRAERVTLGVFENNPKAQRCYESVGFKAFSETVYDICGEEWKCIEMECDGIKCLSEQLT